MEKLLVPQITNMKWYMAYHMVIYLLTRFQLMYHVSCLW